MSAHGIDGHHAPSKGQLAQQLGQGGDLVGYPLGVLIHLHLSQYQAIGGGPGTHQMNGLFAGRSVMGAAHGLAIQGDHLGR
jgi:hypothetical protein